MTTEMIIAILALAFLFWAIVHLIRIGRREAEMIFESDYHNLKEFINDIKDDQVNELNEAKIIIRLNHLAGLKGADTEKLQMLNTEFRRKFVKQSLGNIVADHENY